MFNREGDLGSEKSYADCSMKFWLDAQLSPKLVSWMSINFAVEVYAVRELGLRDAEDQDIFLNSLPSSAW
jgi:hypothetical protein